MIRLLLPLALALAPLTSAAEGFTVVALGARGGIEDGNLSAFLIHPAGDPRGVTCDAGSLTAGLIAGEEQGAFDAVEVPEESEFTRVGHLLTEVIRGYFVSHAHLDHVAGLLVASPDDSAKPIYGLRATLDTMSETYFNWKAWPNFTTEGPDPLGKYEMTAMEPGEAMEVAGTAMTATAFALSHGGIESTAFLFEADGDAILCLGDTGPDAVEEEGGLGALWQAVAPLVREGAMKAIIIESSYGSDRPDDLLFGHLTPRHVLGEMDALAAAAGDAEALRGLPLIISHTKFVLKKGPLAQEVMASEFAAGDRLGLEYLIPEQGMAWTFGGP